MQNVLIIEYNTDLLDAVEIAFKEQEPPLNLLRAEDGEEAINILRKIPVSVLVTDLHMPKVDGLELLAHMSRHHPKTPIIMATVSTPEVMKILDNLGIYRFLKKPFKKDDLINSIFAAISLVNAGKSAGYLSTGSFLQLLQEEQRSCTLTTINHKGLKGRFYLIDGRLYDARRGDLHGEDAAVTILGWEKIALDLKDLQSKEIKARIHSSLKALIAKASRPADKDKNIKDQPPEKIAGKEVLPSSQDDIPPQKDQPSKQSAPEKPLKKEDLADMLLQAMRNAESGNINLAQNILGQILKIYPKSSKTWLWFARTTGDFNKINLSLKNASTIAPEDPEIKKEIKKVQSAVNFGCSESTRLKHCLFCWAPVMKEKTICHYCNAHIDINEDFFQSVFFGSNKEPDLELINETLRRLTKIANSSYENINTHFSLAMAHVNLNHWEEALEELEQTKSSAQGKNPYQKQLGIMAEFMADLGSFYQD